jgi:hypothetical protein
LGSSQGCEEGNEADVETRTFDLGNIVKSIESSSIIKECVSDRCGCVYIRGGPQEYPKAFLVDTWGWIWVEIFVHQPHILSHITSRVDVFFWPDMI